MEEAQLSPESKMLPIIVFSIAAFIGNFGVAVTGFGMAIIFLFVYTIADLMNLVECSRCGLRDAVFFQTLALGAAVPLLLYKSKTIIKNYWSKELIMTFVPATTIGTPTGNFMQAYLPSDILRTIVGSVITALICYELRKLIPGSELFSSCRREEKEEEGKNMPEKNKKVMITEDYDNKNTKKVISHHDCESQEYVGVVNVEEDKMIPLSAALSKIVKRDDHVSSSPQVLYDLVEPSPDREEMVVTTTNSSKKDGTKYNNSIEYENDNNDDHDENSGGDIVEKNEEDEEVIIPTGLRLRIWGFGLGFLSGFLGGLMGVRGPPLMVFFLMFSYPKNIVRANAVLILTVNVSIRIIYYIVEDLAGSRTVPWFHSEYVILYICVVCFGMLGVPIGSFVASKMNQKQFKLVVATMLLFSGLTNLIKGSINLASQ